MMKIGKLFWGLFIVVLFLGVTHNGLAQKYPTKTIRIISPFSGGGTSEQLCRALMKPLSEELKGTIIVESIPGGATKMATLELMKANPDGHTLLLTSHAVLIGYYYSGTYDSKVWEDITVIAQTGESPFAFWEVLVDSPFKNWSDLVSFAKKNPGKLTCAGPNAGGVMNLVVAETAKPSGIDVKYVTFSGAATSVVALLGKHVDYRVCVPSDAYSNIKAGKARGLGISYDKRLPEMPDVPAFKELGIMSESIPFSYDLWGPPNLPPNLVDRLSKAIGLDEHLKGSTG
jgi:tripartite-type tricarboxylate transporter receptor subunit TctC